MTRKTKAKTAGKSRDVVDSIHLDSHPAPKCGYPKLEELEEILSRKEIETIDFINPYIDGGVLEIEDYDKQDVITALAQAERRGADTMKVMMTGTLKQGLPDLYEKAKAEGRAEALSLGRIETIRKEAMLEGVTACVDMSLKRLLNDIAHQELKSIEKKLKKEKP